MHGEIKKVVVTFVVIRFFLFCQVRQELARTFVIQLLFLGLSPPLGKGGEGDFLILSSHTIPLVAAGSFIPFNSSALIPNEECSRSDCTYSNRCPVNP